MLIKRGRERTVTKSFLLKCLENEVAKHFKVHPVDGDSLYAYDDMEFIEFTSCGEFDGKLKKKYKTSIGAVMAFISNVGKYLREEKADGKNHFQWRIRPELSTSFLSNTVYSRFIVSDMPFHKKGDYYTQFTRFHMKGN